MAFPPPNGLTRDYEDFGTRGRVDIVAAFAGPGTVLLHRQDDPSHPDYEVYQELHPILACGTDAQGRPLRVIVDDVWLRDSGPTFTATCLALLSSKTTRGSWTGLHKPLRGQRCGVVIAPYTRSQHEARPFFPVWIVVPSTLETFVPVAWNYAWPR